MAEPRFNTYIFDLDGTLLDTLPDLTLLANRILRNVGYPERSQQEILTFVGNGVRRLIYQALPADAPEDVVERAMQIWNDHFQEYHEHTEPYPGITDMLRKLRERGDRIGVVSNKLQAGVDQIVSMKLPGLVDDMLGESPMVPRKPDPAGIRMMIAGLGAVPERVAYIGDSPGDIRAAHNAGVFAVAVTWGYHDREDFEGPDVDPAARPDAIIDAPEQILELGEDA